MESSPVTASRLERILAGMIAGIIGVSILCFFAVMIGTWLGAGAAQQSGSGIWTLVIMFPEFGLPIGMVLLFTLMIVSIVRRRRAS